MNVVNQNCDFLGNRGKETIQFGEKVKLCITFTQPHFIPLLYIQKMNYFLSCYTMRKFSTCGIFSVTQSWIEGSPGVFQSLRIIFALIIIAVLGQMCTFLTGDWEYDLSDADRLGPYKPSGMHLLDKSSNKCGFLFIGLLVLVRVDVIYKREFEIVYDSFAFCWY